MIYLKLKYLYWRAFSVLALLNCFAENASAIEPITTGTYLLATAIMSAASAGAAIFGGIETGKAAEAELAYKKEQDRWNNNRTKRIDSQNFRQALFNNKIALRQQALSESSAAFARKRSVLFDVPQILDWFDGFQEKKRAKRIRRAVGEFGIIPVSPAGGGGQAS